MDFDAILSRLTPRRAINRFLESATPTDSPEVDQPSNPDASGEARNIKNVNLTTPIGTANLPSSLELQRPGIKRKLTNEKPSTNSEEQIQESYSVEAESSLGLSDIPSKLDTPEIKISQETVRNPKRRVSVTAFQIALEQAKQSQENVPAASILETDSLEESSIPSALESPTLSVPQRTIKKANKRISGTVFKQVMKNVSNPTPRAKKEKSANSSSLEDINISPDLESPNLNVVERLAKSKRRISSAPFKEAIAAKLKVVDASQDTRPKELESASIAEEVAIQNEVSGQEESVSILLPSDRSHQISEAVSDASRISTASEVVNTSKAITPRKPGPKSRTKSLSSNSMNSSRTTQSEIPASEVVNTSKAITPKKPGPKSRTQFLSSNSMNNSGATRSETPVSEVVDISKAITQKKPGPKSRTKSLTSNSMNSSEMTRSETAASDTGIEYSVIENPPELAKESGNVSKKFQESLGALEKSTSTTNANFTISSHTNPTTVSDSPTKVIGDSNNSLNLSRKSNIPALVLMPSDGGFSDKSKQNTNKSAHREVVIESDSKGSNNNSSVNTLDIPSRLESPIPIAVRSASIEQKTSSSVFKRTIAKSRDVESDDHSEVPSSVSEPSPEESLLSRQSITVIPETLEPRDSYPATQSSTAVVDVSSIQISLASTGIASERGVGQTIKDASSSLSFSDIPSELDSIETNIPKRLVAKPQNTSVGGFMEALSQGKTIRERTIEKPAAVATSSSGVQQDTIPHSVHELAADEKETPRATTGMNSKVTERTEMSIVVARDSVTDPGISRNIAQPISDDSRRSTHRNKSKKSLKFDSPTPKDISKLIESLASDASGEEAGVAEAMEKENPVQYNEVVEELSEVDDLVIDLPDSEDDGDQLDVTQKPNLGEKSSLNRYQDELKNSTVLPGRIPFPQENSFLSMSPISEIVDERIYPPAPPVTPNIPKKKRRSVSQSPMFMDVMQKAVRRTQEDKSASASKSKIAAIKEESIKKIVPGAAKLTNSTSKGASIANPSKGKTLAVSKEAFETEFSDPEWEEIEYREEKPLPLHVAYEELPERSKNFIPLVERLKLDPVFQAKVKIQKERKRAEEEAQKKKLETKPRTKKLLSEKRLPNITYYPVNKGNFEFYARRKIPHDTAERVHELVDEWVDFTLDQIEHFCLDEGKNSLETWEDCYKLLKRQGIVKNYWEYSGLCHDLLLNDECRALLPTQLEMEKKTKKKLKKH